MFLQGFSRIYIIFYLASNDTKKHKKTPKNT
nr:MAG TPA: hypothetical protein [Caudoviricetes sp.]